jgi:Cyclic nucleotide-binding domain
MSRSREKKPIKPSTKAARGAVFDPAVFLATAALGRDISVHSKKELIFAQGEPADAVFYIKRGRVKVAVVSKDGKEAVVALLGPDVSYFMNKFRKLGFIDYNGHLEVHNSLVGVLLVDEPRTVSPQK